jgi:hypothetical protein
METVRTVEVLGPPWVMITIAVISLGGVVVTALVGPLVVERFKSGRTTPVSPESSAIAQLASRFSEHEKVDQANADQFRSESQANQQLAQGAHDLGVNANAELTRRGLEPVRIPIPGTVSDSQVLAAAARAEVATKIARESNAALTPTQIQTDIAAALAKLTLPTVGSDPQQLAAAVMPTSRPTPSDCVDLRVTQERLASLRPAWLNPPSVRVPKGTRASEVSRQ